MQLANKEAQRLQCEYIGTGHVLLGLIEEQDSVAVAVLKNLGVDLGRIRRSIENLSQPGMTAQEGLNRPQVPRVKKVIESAIDESRKLRHSYIGSEHLLLGLLREQEGVAAQGLMNEGLTFERVGDEVVRLLSLGTRGKPVPSAAMSRLTSAPINDFPDDVQAAVAPFDDEIDRLQQEKEAAIAGQNFDKAAALRDEQDKLRRQRRAAVHDWAVSYPIDLAWLSSNDRTVLDLAQRIHEHRRWDALPQLANALEQAGCTDARMLDHCRQNSPHSEQCWVVDLILARADARGAP
ncbi:MAG TPA: Clp protease N-terminal domain-containing protein [Pirellulales bacterium]|nr:Clp protease N-terminal domain-containing protein [Pirellulales bacterium]